MIFKKAYKLRIYPNRTQKVLLNKTFGCIRYVWNNWTEIFNSKDKEKEKIFKTPKQFKKELDWMNEISSAAIQQKERDFKEFKKQFFNSKRKIKFGKPSFKSKNKKQSYRLPNQKFTVNQKMKRVRIEKIGWIKTVFDRVIPEKVKFLSITISKDLINNYYVSILVEEDIKPKNKTNKIVGIDVGLKHFAIFSSGEKVENPSYFRENQSKVRMIQKHLSRKKKGSNHYRKNKLKLAKTHSKIERQRNHFLHTLSCYLVNNFDVMGIEDLNVLGMLKNRKLSKSISDVSWSSFFKMLEYKSEWYQKRLMKVGMFEPTSKKCSRCGYLYHHLTLDIREWICPECGEKHDRDVNAAKNILKESLGVTGEIQTWSDCKTYSEVCLNKQIVEKR